MRRRKVAYPTPKKGGQVPGAAARPAGPPSNTVAINPGAMLRRTDIVQGARVRVVGGAHEGEVAFVESVVGGVIPAALVRTESGVAWRVRTTDLRPDVGE